MHFCLSKVGTKLLIGDVDIVIKSESIQNLNFTSRIQTQIQLKPLQGSAHRHALGGKGCPPVLMFADARGKGF